MSWAKAVTRPNTEFSAKEINSVCDKDVAKAETLKVVMPSASKMRVSTILFSRVTDVLTRDQIDIDRC